MDPNRFVHGTISRYALNAANSRWGSLYDALYGTDALHEDDGATRAGGYNPIRGAKVIAYARKFLDDNAPLAHGSHADATTYAVHDGALRVTLGDGTATGLADPALCVGFRGKPDAPHAIVRSEERRVGKEGVRTFRSRWGQYN